MIELDFNDDDFEEKPKSTIERESDALRRLGTAGIKVEDLDENVDTLEKVIPFNKMIENLSNNDYHSFYAISASGLKQAYKDPKLYANKDKLMRLPSPALDIGTAAHEALLEPDDFRIDNYKLTPANVTKLEIMINNGKVMFDYILSKTENERSLFFKDNGFIRKVRPDAYDAEKGIIYDVKTTRYSDPDKFARDAYNLGYFIQASYYVDTLRLAGYKADYFAFLVIPNESPCEPFAFQVGDFEIEDGREKYTEIIQNILDYKSNNRDEVFFKELKLPKWRIDQINGYND